MVVRATHLQFLPLKQLQEKKTLQKIFAYVISRPRIRKYHNCRTSEIPPDSIRLRTLKICGHGFITQ
ncbi:hypothetical protein RCL_jg3113.t1 [Rhizophagus clarus]|uniref:Uncharacterized protein n=1 Tax=Rhizophagus clarus TaxID=94130 RepID=A0A8H3MC39_9GLOM|nr:hypothetical protein RCL_jg3113.t1 [Rhizophagus clarus]